MKKILIAMLFCLAFQLNYSQETYTVNGETLELKTEIDGKLDLLWNVIDGKYRYFVKTEDGTITELKNTKDDNNDYQEEYKSTLSSLTNGNSTDKLKLTLYSLRNYIDSYNASVDTSYTSTSTESNVQFRLGFSGGITNNPFVGNPDNTKTPLIGAELEIYEANVLPRHSGFLQARHAFENDDFKYSTSELSLGYRFRFINKETFSIYGQVKFATVNFSNFTFLDENDMEVDSNETSFDIPFIFGVGSDIKVGNNSYITIIYGELFALLLDNQGNFSTDIAIGYKFNL
ncbi:MAG: hypothetical protein CMC05_06855 [Flavobacteriaceae bacterium]|nr:hypothetical protein [Flavobacteriaceae bacterium]|tara:strand:+ start:8728 stop:9591 length:864 start_codon:yes stop_codon:yes gene_type:complete